MSWYALVRIFNQLKLIYNTFNYTYSDTEFAKVKCSDGTIKTIGYTS